MVVADGKDVQVVILGVALQSCSACPIIDAEIRSSGPPRTTPPSCHGRYLIYVTRLLLALQSIQEPLYSIGCLPRKHGVWPNSFSCLTACVDTGVRTGKRTSHMLKNALNKKHNHYSKYHLWTIQKTVFGGFLQTARSSDSHYQALHQALSIP